MAASIRLTRCPSFSTLTAISLCFFLSAAAAPKSKKTNTKSPKKNAVKTLGNSNENDFGNNNFQNINAKNENNAANAVNASSTAKSKAPQSENRNVDDFGMSEDGFDSQSNYSQQETSANKLAMSEGDPSATSRDEDESESDEGAKAEQENRAFFYDSRRNPHPRFPTSHATKRLILTFLKPKEETLNLCVKEFRAAADTATNADSMVQTMKLMTAAVSKNIKFYHWCFYHFVSALDWKLEEDSLGLQLQDKMTIFTKNMKGLWLLARSLDEAVKTKIYFDFIKVRYVELSLSHFGRSLDVISPPLGDPRWIEPTKYFRPAGAFEK